MRDLQFSVGTFGAFDSGAIRNYRPKDTRLIDAYEFEFYTQDYPGGQYNDDVFCPARKNHCTLAKPGQLQRVVRPAKGYYLNIHTQDPELCDQLDQLPGSFELWDMEEVVRRIEQMIATGGRDTVTGRLLNYGYTCGILAILCTYLQLPTSLEKIPSQHRQTLLSADRYIRDHYFEEISLETVSREFSLEKTYFHKLYTTAFGKTPAQRILALRICAAKRGLTEDKLSLTELAMRCGFSSQSYFCYKFKQVVGQTPLRYRESIRKQMEK